MPTTHAANSQYDVSDAANEWTVVDSVVPEEGISIVSGRGARADDTVDSLYAREQTKPRLALRIGVRNTFALRQIFLLVILFIPMGLSLISWASPDHVLLAGFGLVLMWFGFGAGVLGIYAVGLKTNYYLLEPRNLILFLAICIGLAVSAILSLVRLAIN